MGWVCEFQTIKTGQFFGWVDGFESRAAAEQHAIETLIGLGEPRADAEAAAAAAGYGCADTRNHDGYGVRIFNE